MSRSYHKYLDYASGMNTKHFRACAKAIRRKNKQMLKDKVPVCYPEQLDEELFHHTKHGHYDYRDAPADYRIWTNKAKLVPDLDDPDSWVNSNIYQRRRTLIMRSRLSGFPEHHRKKYPYKDLLEVA